VAQLMAALTIQTGARVVQARVDSDGTVTVDDTRFEVTRSGPGLWAVRLGDRTWQVAVAGPPDRRWVAIAGQVAVVEVEKSGAPVRRPRSAGTEGMVAPMPATVVAVNVEAGRAVSRGEVVLVLEAMKMELPVRATRDGVIKSVRCSPGELVQPGVPLVEFE
jgi:biotin carboxyl carrier protein